MKTLTKKQQAILAAIKFNADAPLASLTKITGCRVHTIRYAVSRLLEQGIIRYYPFMNVCPLGYVPYSLLFSFHKDKWAVRDKVIEYLKTAPLVSWIAECGGDYQYTISILGRSATEVQDFLSDLNNRFGLLFESRTMVVVNALTLFPQKYLFQPLPGQDCISWTPNKQAVKIDELDKQILSGLLHLRYNSKRELSRLLSIAFSSLDLRIKKLQELGIIVAFMYLINAERLGYQSYKLLVATGGSSPAIRSKLFEFCRAHKNIVALLECLGPWEYEIQVEVAGSAQVMTITDELHRHFPQEINSVRAMPLLRELKVDCFPFEAEASAGNSLRARAANA